MTQATPGRRLPLNGATSAAVTVCALLSFTFSALTGWKWVGIGLGVVVVLATFAKFVLRRPQDLLSAQLLVTAGFLVSYGRGRSPEGTEPTLTITAVMIMGLMLYQIMFKKTVGHTGLRVAHLPGATIRTEPFVSTRAVGIMTTVLAALIALSDGLAAPPWPLAVLTSTVAGVFAAMLVDGVLRKRRVPRHPPRVRAAVEAYRPEFIVYFSAPSGSEYQLLMWLPYLERVGRPFIVVVRETHSFNAVAAAAHVPVVYCPSSAAVEKMITDTVRACYYVNNGAKNGHMVRFSHLTHVQLLHGDSDKPPSHNPVTAMFDKIYVAGQAGIDRYAANGVTIPAERFTIVGRPQVESIAVATRPIGDIHDKTVLYAPTWVGYFTDSCHCSLPIGDKIVAALLARGARVILRPHPYSARDADSARQIARMEQMLAADQAATGRDHVYGERATTAMGIVDCMNTADALVSDVSSVASDFLYSGKPFVLTDMLNDGPHYATVFPLARAAYVLRHDAANLDDVLDDLLGADPLEFTRQGMKEYYLGDFPAGSYADAFLDAIRAELGTRTRVSGSLPAAFTPARAVPDEPAVLP